MDFNAAIFDLDGTILDSMDVWEHIDIQFLKKSRNFREFRILIKGFVYSENRLCFLFGSKGITLFYA